MLIRGAILLTVLAVIPSTLSRHIERKVEKDSNSERADESSSWQLQKTHLRIHIKPPRTLRVLEGSSQFLECQAGGSPAPSVHWLKDGKVISQSESSEDHPILSSGGDIGNSVGNLEISFTSSRLYLDCLSLEDEAVYNCVAENPFQRTSTTTRVIVASSDDEIACSKNLRGQRPRVHTWTKTMIATQGQQTRLICRADGYPRATIRWLGSNEEELAKADTSKYEILSNGDLIVRNLEWSDMGNYICVAENIHGESRAEVFLYPAVPDPDVKRKES